jgi:mercuric ion binding protein
MDTNTNQFISFIFNKISIMKHLSFLIIIMLTLVLQAKAQDKSLTTASYKVYGNCGMCKSTIEKAANGVKGVNSAVWEVTTDTITVTFDNRKTTPDKILQAIAESGYDSDTHRAPDEAYNKLHGCCQYDRPKKEQ